MYTATMALGRSELSVSAASTSSLYGFSLCSAGSLPPNSESAERTCLWCRCMVCDKLRRGQTVGDEEFRVRVLVLNRSRPSTISCISTAPVLKVSRPAGEDPAARLHFLGSSEHWSSVKARLTRGTSPWFASDGQPGTQVSDERHCASWWGSLTCRSKSPMDSCKARRA